MAVAEDVEQIAGLFDRFVLDIDAAEAGGSQHAKRRKHDAAATAHFQHTHATHTLGLGSQGLDQDGGILAWPQQIY